MYNLLLLLLFLVGVFVAISWLLTLLPQYSSLDDTILDVYCHPMYSPG